MKRECLKMYVNGMGFRGIERVKGVQTLADSLTLRYHTTLITWVKLTGSLLPDTYDPETIPEVGELDELETFVGSKKTLIWLWTAVNHFTQGILARKAEGRRQKAEGNSDSCPLLRPLVSKGLSPTPKFLIWCLAISVGLKPTLYCSPSALCPLTNAFFTVGFGRPQRRNMRDRYGILSALGSATSMSRMDGWSIQALFGEGDQIVSKTYMTRVEGENTRLRHPERSIASQNAMLFQISTNAEILNSIVTSLSQILGCSSSGMIHTAIMQRRKRKSKLMRLSQL